MEDRGSTVPRRQLGRHLRQLRETAKITIRDAATAVECSTQKIWRIENGAVAVRAVDVRGMCETYGADDQTTQALVTLARETKARGWWHQYSQALPGWFELYVGLEESAVQIRQYAPELIPGLLQAPEYATEVFEADANLSATEVAQRVSVRMERKRLLTRDLPPPPRLSVVLGEAAIRRRLRKEGAMARQLRLIKEIGTRPGISVRVLPIGSHLLAAFTAGEFSILDFAAKGGEPTTVYSEGLSGAWYGDLPEEVAAHENAWKEVVEASLPEAQSAAMLHELAEAP